MQRGSDFWTTEHSFRNLMKSHESSFNFYSWARIHRTIHGHIVKVFIKILRVMTSNSHENRGQFVTV